MGMAGMVEGFSTAKLLSLMKLVKAESRIGGFQPPGGPAWLNVR